MVQTGRLDEKALNLYLACADVFWLPLEDSNANRGRFPLKLTDYLAVGRPIVATAVGDVATLLGEETAGLVSLPEPQAFAVQTLRLFNEPVLREAMGRNGRLLAEGRLNWENLAEELERFYLRVMQT